MKMIDKLNELKNVFQKSYKNLYDVCCEILSFILVQDKESQLEYFTLFLCDLGLNDLSSENPENFLDEESLGHITDDAENLCKRIIDNLIKENVSEKEFYKELWEKLVDNVLLPDGNAQATFLMCLWLDPRIPYFQLERGIKMDDETFTCALDRIKPQLKKAFFIMSVPFEQKTQRASLFMSLADELESNERVVFWAVITSQLMRIGSISETEQGTDITKENASK